MMIGFFVNDLEREYENYTTTVLAHQAASRGHRVCYITPSDFVLNADDTLSVHARFLPKRKYKDRAEFFKTLKDTKAIKIERVDVTEIDVLMLRNDPSIDAQTPWAMEAGILFGREAVRRGVIVLNDPDSLGRAINKLYFQSFPVRSARRDPDHQAQRPTSRLSPRRMAATSSSSPCRDRVDRACSSSTPRTRPTSTRSSKQSAATATSLPRPMCRRRRRATFACS